MSHQQVNQTSLEVEFYTTAEIIERARSVMGSIDLDPASCIKANRIVKASKIYTKRANGLTKPWKGNVWMNHPWGAYEKACHPTNCTKKRCEKRGYHLTEDFPGNAAWITKLHDSYQKGQVEQALCITYASTSEKWFKTLKANYAMCLLDGRTAFYSPTGKLLDQNTKGCAVTYLGNDIATFNEHFSDIGDVMIPFNITVSQKLLAA
jgi:hypothetical protein